MTVNELKCMKIGVLMGGLSAEREVSLKSGGAVLNALLEKGYNAVAIDAGRSLAEDLVSQRIDCAFVSLHGRYGEDGTVQGMLELLGIPYTGSGVLASALAMDKVFAKKVFASSGLTISPYVVLNAGESFSLQDAPFGLPLVVKPAREGSSVGVSIVHDISELTSAIAGAFTHDRSILLEKFIKGREIQVGILDDRAIGTIEIIPKNEFYDYEAKYTAGKAEHRCPAPLSPALHEKVMAAGTTAHRSLGCSGYSRVDFLVTDEEECYLLEVNTLPGMTALSLFPEIAQYAGIGFADLVEGIACSASKKL